MSWDNGSWLTQAPRVTPMTGLSQGDGHSTLDPEEGSVNTVVWGYQVQGEEEAGKWGWERKGNVSKSLGKTHKSGHDW